MFDPEITAEETVGYCADPTILGNAAKLLVSELDLHSILQKILDNAIVSMGAMRGFIALVDYDRGDLVVPYVSGEGWDEEKRKLRLKVSEETGRGITSHVAAIGESHRSGYVEDDPYYLPFFTDVMSELAVPMVDANGRTRGVINIESREKDAFGQGHQEFIESLASIATAAIMMSDHRVREMALIDVGKDLTRITNIPQLLRKVLDVTAEALRFEDCSLFLTDTATQELVLRGSRGGLSEKVGQLSYQIGEGLTGWVAAKGEPIRIAKPNQDTRWRGVHQEFPPEDIGAFMAVPITGRDRVLGVLRVMRKRSPYKWFPNDFTADDERIVSIIGSQIGVALENAYLVDRLVNAQRMAAWGEMSARSAHMIGNRLFAIKGDLNELDYVTSDNCGDRQAIKELLGSIRNGVFSLEEILAEFREFVMATKLSAETTDLNEIVNQSVSESFPKRSPVKLHMNLADSLPKIQADPVKLKRCFSEIMENSINFQPDGGEFSVTTVKADPEELREIPNAPNLGEFVRVTFSDRGPGVPEENKSRIFTPFFSTRSKGMGLGLSIVKGIIDAHHGFIYESGESGNGASFTILLPCVSEKMA